MGELCALGYRFSYRGFPEDHHSRPHGFPQDDGVENHLGSWALDRDNRASPVGRLLGEGGDKLGKTCEVGKIPYMQTSYLQFYTFLSTCRSSPTRHHH